MKLPSKIVLILLSHNNDFERLKHYPDFFKDQARCYFISYSSFEKQKFTVTYPLLSFNTSKLHSLFLYFWIFINSLSYKMLLISAHKSQIKDSSTLGRLIRLIHLGKGKVAFVPHGINSYEMEPTNDPGIKADVVLYNTPFELEHTVYKKYVGKVPLIHVGDLKLLEFLHHSQTLKEKFQNKFNACILASNLNRYGFSDEEKLNVIRECVRFVGRSFDLGSVVFRPHPRYLQFAQVIKEEFPTINIDSNKSNEQTILESNYVITVTSSVAYESLLLNRPTLIVEPDHFKALKSVFSDSCLQHFYSSQLKDIDLLSLPFDLPRERQWVIDMMVVSSEAITAKLLGTV